MKQKSYTLMAEVSITFVQANPWEDRKHITAMLTDTIAKTFDAAKVEVSISEMQHGEIDLPDQKLDLVKPYGTYRKDGFRISNMPPEVAEQLYGPWPNLDPEDSFNRSPKMRKLVELAKKHNGTLEGDVFPVESGRSDARIAIDAIYLKCSKEDAQRLRRNLRPDEFDFRNGVYRFWWD
jgi:hypothetical protein